MKIIDFSVNRPVAVLMAVFMVLILGFVSLTNLSIDLLPEMNLPVALVTTSYPGAGPQEVENLVTRPLESVLGTVNNVKKITSLSSSGQSMIVLELDWGTDMDFATLQMREKVDLIKGALPDDVEEPVVMKMDPNILPIMQFGVTGEMSMADLHKLADDLIVGRLERVPGVASATFTGGREREIQVQLDPAKLNYYGLSLNQVMQALQADNLELSGGSVEKGSKEFLVRVSGEFQSPREVGDVVVSAVGGTVIRVKDVAEIIDGYKEVTAYDRINGKESLIFQVYKQTGANTVKVSQDINRTLEELKKELPQNVQIVMIWDSAEYIQQAIDNVKSNLIYGGILAVLVLYIFLRNVRSTLVIGITIPICVIGTFVLIYFGKLTLNMMSLGGLALGVGMMVDNSIVILENIYRHREKGLGRIEAAKTGAAEVAMAITASTLTTVVVFLPVVFVQGIAGQVFKQMALTITFSLTASLLVALTLSPMLCSRLLRVSDQNNGESKKEGFLRKLFVKTEQWYDALDEGYRKLLRWALNHRGAVVIIVLVLMGGSLATLPLIGAEFIPAIDQGYLSIQVKLPYGSKLEETERVISKLEAIAHDIPEVELVAAGVGGSSSYLGGMMMGGSGESGRLDLVLKPLTERTRSVEDVAEQIRQAAKDIPGAEITISTGDTAMGMMGVAPISVQIKGDDLDVLNDLAQQVVAAVKSVPGTREVEADMEEGRPEVQVFIHRQKASSYGLSVAQIASAVRGSIQGQVVTKYRTGGDEIDVRLRLSPEKIDNIEDLRSLTLLSPMGAQVPLGEVAQIKVAQGPNVINRDNQVRTVTVSAQIVGRDLRSVTNDVQAKIDELYLPPGYDVTVGGQAEEMAESFGDLGLALVLAVILVYMVMAAQYESLLHPLVIMFSMPVVSIGVFLGLLIAGYTFNVITLVGVIMLAGIVVNNAIVLVDYINTLRRRGMGYREAILEAGPTRLRPILMTALTTILGSLPMALGIGEGAEYSAPLGVVLIGGLTTSTLLTLVFIPVVYSLAEDLVHRIKNRKEKKLSLTAKA